jgi:hypothetical protein
MPKLSNAGVRARERVRTRAREENGRCQGHIPSMDPTRAERVASTEMGRDAPLSKAHV